MLGSVLDGTAPARVVVVIDSLAAPAAPLVAEMVARAQDRAQPTLTIACTSGTALKARGRESHPALDLSAAVKGYSDIDVEAEVKAACATLVPTTQVYIDAVDLIAEDYGTAVAFRVLRAILAKVQGGRLILSLPRSAFTSDVLAATLSPSLALLTPHHARAVESVSRALLVPASDDRFWHHLAAPAWAARGDVLAFAGADGVDVNPADEQAVLVLLRKATGGAKAMVRSLEGLQRQKGAGAGRWDVVALDQVVSTASALEMAAKVTTHADLALPFNLSLTDRQRAERGAVPLPYAHEGEGADLGMGMDWSDDEEDDEI